MKYYQLARNTWTVIDEYIIEIPGPLKGGYVLIHMGRISIIGT